MRFPYAKSIGLRRLAYGGSGAGASASEQLLTLATDDGWTALYDPTNPDTRTLRNDGSDDYLSAIADGLGNFSDLVQATAADQPLLSRGALGQLDAALGDGVGAYMRSASAITLSQPFIWVTVARLDDLTIDTNRQLLRGETGIVALFTHTNELFNYYAGTRVDDGSFDSDPHVWSMVFDGASSKLIKDGVTIATGNPGTNVPSSLYFLSEAGSPSSWDGPGCVWCIRNDGDETKMAAMTDLLHDLSGVAKA